MLTLSQFMSRTYDVRNRPGVSRSLIRILDFVTSDDGNTIVFRVGSQSDSTQFYKCKILLKDYQITPMTNVKFHCTCPSFKFQFESILFKNEALIGIPSDIKLPKKPQLHICKHLEGCLNYLITFKNLDYISSKIKHQLGANNGI